MAVKPGTPHPTRKGMVMGKNGSYVSKTTYAKQVKAAKAATSAPSKPQVQRALPAAGQSGGSRPPKGTKQPGTTRGTVVDRRSAAASKKAGASMGSKGSGVQVGKPAKPGVGARVRAGAGTGARVAAGLGVGSYIAGKLVEAANPETWKKKSKELQERYGSSSSAKPKPKPKASDKDVAALTKPGGMFYQGPGKPKPKPQPSRQNSSGPSSRPAAAKPKPKPQPKPQTSGVGPVASGRTYSVKKTGKSVMQQQADELRAMRKASQERQAADKKKLEASKKKRKYNR